MARAYASAVVAAAAGTVWGFVRDFNNLPQWHPAITDSRIDPGPGGRPSPADAVGCIRRLTTTDGGEVVEKLLRLDDLERSYTYAFVEHPPGVRSYVSTIRFTPVTDTGHTFGQWWADFDCEAGAEAEWMSFFGRTIFADGLSALRDRFST